MKDQNISATIKKDARTHPRWIKGSNKDRDGDRK